MEQGQELIQFKAIIKRRKWWLILPALIAIVVAGAVALSLPNIYQSSATIMVQKQQIATDLVPTSVTSYVDQRIQALTQQVMSRTKILQLVNKYDLLPDIRKKLTTEDLVDRIKEQISIELIDAEVKKETSNKPVLLTIAFTLAYEDREPKKAQAVTNEIASYYLEKNLESRGRNLFSLFSKPYLLGCL